MNKPAPKYSPAEIEAAASDWTVRRDSGLTAQEQRELDLWQDADPQHRAALLRHGRTWSLLDRPRSSGRAEEMGHALQRALRRRRRNRVGLAAALLMIGVAVNLTWREIRSPQDVPSVVRLIAPATKTLADGTVIEFKTGAEFAVDYSGQFRRVALKKGEAVFHVAKNKERPFIVTAQGVDVRAVGTAFLVGLDPTLVDVIVTEGTVAVNKTPLTQSAPSPTTKSETALIASPTLVDAGKRLTIGTESSAPISRQAIEISPAETAERLAWRTTWLEFFHTPLADAVQHMNQYSTLRLVVDDEELGRLPVNGLFRADNAETLARLLEANFGVKAERVGNTIRLRRAL